MAGPMRVGKRIAVGFSIVIVISVVLGEMGVWSMQTAKTDSEMLTSEYIPEVRVATALRGAASRLMYQMRGYGLTNDPTYYEAAKKELAAVDKHLAEAKDLAEKAVHFKALKGQVKEATAAVDEYKKLIEETVATNKRIEGDYKELNRAAAAYMENATALLKHQNEMMQEELGGDDSSPPGTGSEASHGGAAPQETADYNGSIVNGSITAQPCPKGDQTIEQLKQGNLRYVQGHLTNPHINQERRTETVVGNQHPPATILACSDSRVPVGALFDQGIGDLFPVRVAGNVCAVDELGSIEYGVDHLETPLLVVLGHTNCGAVTAVVTGATTHGSIPALLKNIQPSVAKVLIANPGLIGSALVNAGVVENVWHSIEQVLTKSRAVQERVKAGKVKVVGAVYDIENGTIKWLGTHPQQSRLLAVAVEEPPHATDDATVLVVDYAAKRLERLEKITLVNDVIELGNATQLACFKSQSLHHPTSIEKARVNFDTMETKFASLRQITRLKEDLNRITKIEAEAANYKTAMDDLLDNWLVFQKLDKQQQQAGQHLIVACQTTSDAGMTNTDRIASHAAASLSASSTIMNVGLAIGTLLGIVCAFWISRSVEPIPGT